MVDANRQQILFSDCFHVEKETVEDYGAFNISLLSDLPLFIDPFLLFNSTKEEYQSLHEGMIRYLTFLRDKSINKEVTPGLLDVWYRFTEVKQTWLGFAKGGNQGSGLGPKFAGALDRGFHRLFGDEGEEQITESKHLEKLCLIQEGVGRDNISDFTTNLIKEYLLSYTQEFAKAHLNPEQCRTLPIPKVRFNYETESWETRDFTLPIFKGDYVLLVPRNLLTRDETWINREDLINSFDALPPAISDLGLRAQVNNYFLRVLPDGANDKKRKQAAADTIAQFPQLIDYYIKLKEEHGDEAVAASNKKVIYAESLFLENFTRLADLVSSASDFYQHGVNTLEDALARVTCLKQVVESKAGYQFLYNGDRKPVTAEDELGVAYRFIWFNPVMDGAAQEPANSKSAVPVEFKLASNRNLKKYLNKKNDEALEAEAEENGVPKPTITVIFAFSDFDRERVENYLKDFKSTTRYIRIIDASGYTEEVKLVSSPQKNPRVFISYSHDKDVWKDKNQDPETHRKRVFQLAERLRDEGVECVLDQQIVNPAEGWPRWMMNQIEDADFVLVVATETYNKRFRGKEERDKGFGSQWEGAIITQEIYEANGQNLKFVPIIFESADALHIPLPLRSATYYNVSSGWDEELYFYLTNQPPYVPTPLGPIRQRPPR